MKRLSAGVLVTDGVLLLLGHATGSPRWDIPKGLVEPGEAEAEAAARELAEETGLVVAPEALRPLGRFAYLRDKDLVLFLHRTERLPDPAALACRSTYRARDGTLLPEFDRFALVPWEEALRRVGHNLARLLTEFAGHGPP
jgi:8-oxo-dGTP pyrophosphatase MutT (NUDIX family)